MLGVKNGRTSHLNLNFQVAAAHYAPFPTAQYVSHNVLRNSLTHLNSSCYKCILELHFTGRAQYEKLLLLLLLLLLVIVLLLLLQLGLSLGGSSPYTSTDKTNKNKIYRNETIPKQSTNNTKHSKYKYTYYHPHNCQNTPIYTHSHITKQVKTTPVQDTHQMKQSQYNQIPSV